MASYEYDPEREVLIRISSGWRARILRRSRGYWSRLPGLDEDESYSRAIFLGQGCWDRLYSITEEEAQKVLKEWGFKEESAKSVSHIHVSKVLSQGGNIPGTVLEEQD